MSLKHSIKMTQCSRADDGRVMVCAAELVPKTVNWYWNAYHARNTKCHQLAFQATHRWGSRRQPWHRWLLLVKALPPWSQTDASHYLREWHAKGFLSGFRIRWSYMTVPFFFPINAKVRKSKKIQSPTQLIRYLNFFIMIFKSFLKENILKLSSKISSSLRSLERRTFFNLRIVCERNWSKSVTLKIPVVPYKINQRIVGLLLDSSTSGHSKQQ